MLDDELSQPYDKSQSHKSSLSYSKYSLGKLDLFKACMKREILLMKRNSFIYIFKTVQVITKFKFNSAKWYLKTSNLTCFFYFVAYNHCNHNNDSLLAHSARYRLVRIKLFIRFIVLYTCTPHDQRSC